MVYAAVLVFGMFEQGEQGGPGGCVCFYEAQVGVGGWCWVDVAADDFGVEFEKEFGCCEADS